MRCTLPVRRITHGGGVALARCLLVGTVLVSAGPALAQIGGSGTPRGPMMPDQANPARRPPPAALPGLANRQRAEPIPGDVPAISMSPSAALFDAINRGDLAGAREAMSRGADLDARNALGLAPVDAAVDQGRTDIAFYLLSARAGSSRPSYDPAQGPAAAAPVPAGPTPARREASRRPASREPGPRERVAATERPPAQAQRPPAGGGGTPRPEAGFLGFDAGRGG